MEYLTFTFYIRFFIEAFLLLSLSTTSELYRFNILSLASKISFGISILLSVFIISSLWITLYFWKTSPLNQPEDTKSKFKELFSGTKDTKFARLFTFWFLLRRFFSVIWVIVSVSLPKTERITIYWCIQLVFLLYTFSQSLELKKENIVLMINDSTYLVLATMLIFFNTLPAWNDLSVYMTLGFLTLSTLIVAGIQFWDSIRSLYKTVRNCFVDKKKVVPTTGIVTKIMVPKKEGVSTSVVSNNMRNNSYVSDNTLVRNMVSYCCSNN